MPTRALQRQNLDFVLADTPDSCVQFYRLSPVQSDIRVQVMLAIAKKEMSPQQRRI